MQRKTLSSLLKDVRANCFCTSLSPGQTIATCQRNIVGRNMLRAFGHRVAICCDMLDVVGSSLKLVKFEPTASNMSQHGGQTHATCFAQQCCDMLRWHVAIVWPGLYCARKFTCHVMHRARSLSTKMQNDGSDGHCYSFVWIYLGNSVTPTFLFRNRFYLQSSPHCSKMNKKSM